MSQIKLHYFSSIDEIPESLRCKVIKDIYQHPHEPWGQFTEVYGIPLEFCKFDESGNFLSFKF